ncbi:MAG TPA: dipeptide ABC transporter ATP-binding protein [Burkholderiaceae bacterium]|nr:dipeptide ABC transporter ATP-binding protein [Burkholderiaceae bacterium]
MRTLPRDPASGTAAHGDAVLLAVEHLTTELESDAGLVRAVDDLALTIARGEVVALVGESGCGKSMTALALVPLLPDNGRNSRGSVQLGDVDVLAQRERQMRRVRGRRIGMIFQEPATSLNPVMTVGRQIHEVIRRHTRLRGRAARAQALRWLERVGLPQPGEFLDRYPFQMSGGQKQRVMIALALAGEPDLLIADEPTTALDVTIQGQILRLLAQLQAEQRMAMLLITHDLAIVSGTAHRVALMYAGQIVEVAPTAGFFVGPRHPYAQMLLQALPGSGKRGDDLAAIPGSVPSLSQRFSGCRFIDRCPQAHDACEKPPPLITVGDDGHWVRCVLYDRRARVVLAPREERIPTFLRKAPVGDPFDTIDPFDVSRPRAEVEVEPLPPPRASQVVIPAGLRAAGPAVGPVASPRQPIDDAAGPPADTDIAGRPADQRADGQSAGGERTVEEGAAAEGAMGEDARREDAGREDAGREHAGREDAGGEGGAGAQGAASPGTPAAPTAEDALLRVEQLSVLFSVRRGVLMREVGRTAAVDGVSFTIARGRTLALVGESGSGKTTVAKAVLQLLRGQAQVRGRVLLDGRDLFGLRGEALRAARSDVQIVFQDPFASLNPRMTVAEVLEEGIESLQPRTRPAERRQRVAGLIERVGLRPEALARYPHEFSGGQRQRIAIARALAVQPKLLICDEPTSALDVSVQAQILNLLRGLQRESGMSYLFITHNISVVEYIADELAVMRGGKLIEQGPALELLRQPRHEYTRELLAAVPRVATAS